MAESLRETVRLSQAKIDAARKRGVEELSDLEVSGLYVRFGKRDATYYVRVSLSGKRTRRALGSVYELSVDQARRQALAAKRAAKTGVDPGIVVNQMVHEAAAATEKSGKTWGEAAQEYIEYLLANGNRNRAKDVRKLVENERVQRYFPSDFPIDEVNSDQLAGLAKDYAKDGRSKASRNAASLLRAIVNHYIVMTPTTERQLTINTLENLKIKLYEQPQTREQVAQQTIDRRERRSSTLLPKDKIRRLVALSREKSRYPTYACVLFSFATTYRSTFAASVMHQFMGWRWSERLGEKILFVEMIDELGTRGNKRQHSTVLLEPLASEFYVLKASMPHPDSMYLFSVSSTQGGEPGHVQQSSLRHVRKRLGASVALPHEFSRKLPRIAFETHIPGGREPIFSGSSLSREAVKDMIMGHGEPDVGKDHYDYNELIEEQCAMMREWYVFLGLRDR